MIIIILPMTIRQIPNIDRPAISLRVRNIPGIKSAAPIAGTKAQKIPNFVYLCIFVLYHMFGGLSISDICRTMHCGERMAARSLRTSIAHRGESAADRGLRISITHRGERMADRDLRISVFVSEFTAAKTPRAERINIEAREGGTNKC